MSESGLGEPETGDPISEGAAKELSIGDELAIPEAGKEAEEIAAGAKGELSKSSENPDIRTQLEQQSLLLACAETELFQERVQGVRQDRNERKKYALCIFVLICAWVLSISLLIGLAGFGTLIHFVLPTGVLLAAIGSTTVNVLGLFYIVAHYLFPARDHLPLRGETKTMSGSKSVPSLSSSDPDSRNGT